MTQTKKLLIIDDDPDFVEGMKAILEPAGYTVDVAYNSTDGLRALEKGQHDLLLLDIMMGRGAEGIMVARKVRNTPKLKGMPVLIITGIREEMAFLFPNKPIDLHALVDEIIEKPVEPGVLLDKVSSLLHLSEEKKVHA